MTTLRLAPTRGDERAPLLPVTQAPAAVPPPAAQTTLPGDAVEALRALAQEMPRGRLAAFHRTVSMRAPERPCYGFDRVARAAPVAAGATGGFAVWCGASACPPLGALVSLLGGGAVGAAADVGAHACWGPPAPWVSGPWACIRTPDPIPHSPEAFLEHLRNTPASLAYARDSPRWHALPPAIRLALSPIPAHFLSHDANREAADAILELRGELPDPRITLCDQPHERLAFNGWLTRVASGVQQGHFGPDGVSRLTDWVTQLAQVPEDSPFRDSIGACLADGATHCGDRPSAGLPILWLLLACEARTRSTDDPREAVVALAPHWVSWVLIERVQDFVATEFGQGENDEPHNVHIATEVQRQLRGPLGITDRLPKQTHTFLNGVATPAVSQRAIAYATRLPDAMLLKAVASLGPVQALLLPASRPMMDAWLAAAMAVSGAEPTACTVTPVRFPDVQAAVAAHEAADEALPINVALGILITLGSGEGPLASVIPTWDPRALRGNAQAAFRACAEALTQAATLAVLPKPLASSLLQSLTERQRM